jgi:hypothetical protein
MKFYFVVALISAFSSQPILAADISEQAQQQRKIVKGIYQLTDGALALCPEKNSVAFKETLLEFKQHFPEVTSLVKNSKYNTYAKLDYTDGFEVKQVEATPALTQQCLFKQKMLKNMMSTHEGRQTMAKALATLQ